MSKLDTQSKMNMVNKNMAGIVRSLDRALQANNLEQVSQVSRNLPLPLPLSLSLFTSPGTRAAPSVVSFCENAF